MSRSLQVTEEMLFAYVDGELDPATAARIEAALSQDAALAARVDEQRRLRELLHGRFDPVALEPVPERLLQAAAASPAAATDIQSARRRQASPPTGNSWSWREWGAMAATLVLGLMAGFAWNGPGGNQPLVTRDGGLVAAGSLADALSNQRAGRQADGSSAQIGLSIRSDNGEYCRSFTVQQAAGLACRRGEQWAVDVVVRGNEAAGQGQFRQAGSSLPAAVRSAIEQRMTGEPLTEAEETAQVRAQWRKASAPAGQP
jgi:hypothetical protein